MSTNNFVKVMVIFLNLKQEKLKLLVWYLEDAKRYSNDRRPGRRKKCSK